jgi:hypothetical protein
MPSVIHGVSIMTVQGEDTYVGKISLRDLFDDQNKKLSSERLEGFLENIVDLSLEGHDARPELLVKFIYDGELIILTQEQADRLLKDPSYQGGYLNELRHAVERALKGDVACIRQELIVLVMMARMTLEQFKKESNIDKLEVLRQYPILERTEKEVDKILSDIEDMSRRIEKARSLHPIISEYESKVGQMVNKQMDADLSTARQIAWELQMKKKHYLFCCRSMESDIKGIQFRRLDLQKIKRRLISIHNYLLAQKVNELNIEVDTLKKKIKEQIASGQSIESISNTISSSDPNQENLKELEAMIKVLEEREQQVQSIKVQTNVFQKDESMTTLVINDIESTVCKNSNMVDPTDQIENLTARNKRIEKSKSPGSTKSARMVTLQRRR